MPLLTRLFLLSALSLAALSGCGKKDQVSIACRDDNFSQPADPNINVVPPNAISPNGDLVNDNFRLYGFDKTTQQAVVLPVQVLKIYKFNSRKLVYEKQNYSGEFNGHDNDGRELPEGSYAYEATLSSGTAKGTLVLVRTSKTCDCRTIDPQDPLLSNACQ